MRLRILLIPLLQVVVGDTLPEVSEYFGGTVTLPSGVNPSWTLTKIEWSIFSNNTYIASYRNNVSKVNRIPQYKGRLSMNISSGDLTIHNLTQNDAREYTVELSTEEEKVLNKIKLTVKKRLQKPNIHTQVWVPGTSTKGGCWVEAHCSSPDKDVDFSWKTKPVSVTTLRNPDGTPALLLVFLNTTQNYAEITCISSCKTENSLSAVNITCEDDKIPPAPQPQLQHRSRQSVFFVTGVSVGIVATIIITILFGENIKKAWETLKGNLCTP
ncbi:CD48 antigen BCM1 surface antigen BLAST-1 HM48-1 MRC OX-45 surface antigen SLAM family member 2 [Channa argus]|uniref:CD48 antigen BCM1 surface antigen BLAST-1 HM48-1 MRC OX-45 surface antigen SLAM family member 2 n=1 Tax=Channa argus TaxID=215402 RepID=A0A6G1Q575_CHAAH|nr:CD48 antigen BCM1 surface antigen BLAST-1 HM48-1 MRC OX-45 surface antigen SLAM family member 2 [Channa argus]KAK2899944.1 hypothetical protein Q8A73_013073 [Channa argus]